MVKQYIYLINGINIYRSRETYFFFCAVNYVISVLFNIIKDDIISFEGEYVKKDKNPKIQILRAIAIIAVVIIHTCPIGEIQVYIRPFVNFSVAMFLFLSGYLTDVSKMNVKEFYKKRIIRVLIPYTIWSILYTTIGFTSGGINLKKYVFNYITAGGAATMYYIFVYIQLVLLTPLLGKLLKKKYWYLGFVISPIALLINYYWLLSKTTPNTYISIVWGVCCLVWITSYYLGLYLKNINNKEYNIKKLVLVYILAIALQIAEGYVWYSMGEVNCGTQAKISCLLTSSIFILLAYQYIKSSRFKGNNRLMVLIGNYSFGIYISHLMILTILEKLIPFWKSIPFGINTVIVLVITLLFVIVGKKILGDKISRYIGLC